jgi:YVTN family beta-propeller protein
VDSEKGAVYVANWGSGNVSVIDGTSEIGSVNVGYTPISAVYDSGNGYLYVPNDGGYSNSALPFVSLINGTQGTTTLNLPVIPGFATYDSRNGYVYITDAGYREPGERVAVIDGTTLETTLTVGVDPGPPICNTANGDVYVPNYRDANLSVISGDRVVASINASGLAAYDPGDGYLYIYGSSIVKVFDGTAISASVGLGYKGIPDFAIYDSQSGDMYLGFGNADPANSNVGEVFVLNESAVVGIIQVGETPTAATFDPSDGDVYVSNSGPSANVSAIFPLYALTFVETGLPRGTNWSINLNGPLQISSELKPNPLVSNTSMTTSVDPNGTYGFTVGPVAGYVSSPSSGMINVNGTDISASIIYVSVPPPSRNGASPAQFFGLPMTELLVLLVGIAAVVGATLTVLRIRRRRGPPSRGRPEAIRRTPIREWPGP